MATKPKGFFFPKVVEGYLNDEEHTPDEVEYLYAPWALTDIAAQVVKIFKGGNGGKVSPPPVGEIVCMDVGLWAGDGPKSEKNHQRHREFGVVCGNVVALCSFPGKPDPTGKAVFAQGKKEVLQEPALLKAYDEQIRPFLDYLSSGKAPEHGGLGDVQVENVMVAKGAPEDDTTIHVFLGDLHLPILTEKDKTFLWAEDDQQVPRAGRLSLSEAQKARLLAALQPDPGAVAPRRPWTSLSGMSLAALWDQAAGLELASLLRAAAVLMDEKVGAWDPTSTDGWMSRKEAEEWATYYVGTDKKKGAEIFQGAARDLVAFLELLERWKGSRLHLVQTGDLLDFWIGLKLGFEEGKEGVQPIPGGRGFMKFWREQTANTGRAGNVLQTLYRLMATKRRDLRVFLLYGNHDNYLCREHSAWYAPVDGIVFAEHGHQSDGWNSDEDATWGWALTQLVFLWPWIRDYEDRASTAMTKAGRALSEFTADPGARLQRLARAADVCLKNKKSIYVMGHTHRPTLKKVNVRLLRGEEAEKYELEREIEIGNLMAESAAVVKKWVEKEIAEEEKRVEEWATTYWKENAELARQGITQVRNKLGQLWSGISELSEKSYAEAERKLEAAARDLERLGKITETAARRKVEEAHHKLKDAGEHVASVAERSRSQALFVFHELQRELEAMRHGLVDLKDRSEAHAQEKVDEARVQLEEEIERRRKALESARQELARARSAAGKRAAESLKALEQQAAAAEKKLTETLERYGGRGGGARRAGASGS